mmetsp:Transcript_2442/g.10501  ORF Transcript_2442/g.10501 Transcript_2442/m.10501 type:complete len:215 (-) Transcript_2442:597-1241(-)
MRDGSEQHFEVLAAPVQPARDAAGQGNHLLVRPERFDREAGGFVVDGRAIRLGFAVGQRRGIPVLLDPAGCHPLVRRDVPRGQLSVRRHRGRRRGDVPGRFVHPARVLDRRFRDQDRHVRPRAEPRLSRDALRQGREQGAVLARAAHRRVREDDRRGVHAAAAGPAPAASRANRVHGDRDPPAAAGREAPPREGFDARIDARGGCRRRRRRRRR